MTRGAGVEIDGRVYQLVNEHETYKVDDVPSHPDSDGRMERRVIYESYPQGIQRRRESLAVDTAQISSNLYTRQKSVGGFWWANGCDTRNHDRVFGQRATVSWAGGPLVAGYWRYFLDGPQGASVLVSDFFLFQSQFVSTVDPLLTPDYQQVAVLVSDLRLVWTGYNSNPRRASDAVLFNGQVYIASCLLSSDTSQPTGKVLDYTSPQKYVVWNGISSTLEAPQPYASPIAPTVVATVTGTTTYRYFLVATDGSKDSAPSQILQITNGPNALDSTNKVRITMPASLPAGATSFKLYRAATTLQVQQQMTGLIASNLGVGDPFDDIGTIPSAEYSPTTPGFAVGDTGLASSFVVIRDTLWRAAGSLMWAWKTGNGNWSATQHIGDPSTAITALDSYEDDLLIFKPDGLWTMDRGGNVFPLFPGVRMPGLNPRPIGQWRGAYYFAADYGMVWEWDGDKVTSIGFDKSEPYPMASGTRGVPNAATRGVALPNYLLVGFNQALSTSNTGYILAWDGSGWQSFYHDPQHIITGIGVGGANRGSVQVPAWPALQIGSGSFDGTQNYLNHMSKPTLDPLLANTLRFSANAQTFYFPVDPGAVPDEFKILESIRVYVENQNAGTIRFAYAIDDDIQNQVFTELGAPQFDRGFIQTFIPTTPYPTYRKLLLRMTITPSATSGTPIVRSVIQRYKQRVFQRKSWEMQLFLEEGQITPRRTRDNRSAIQMLQHLNDARESKKLVTFKDIVGKEHDVYVEFVGESIKAYRNRNFTPTFICTVRLTEPASVIS